MSSACAEEALRDGVIAPETLETLLSQAHILDGEGSSFEYMCRLAKSQNAKPVVFLDGDKQADIVKINEKHPEVPVILLSSGIEFEQIVPRRSTFKRQPKCWRTRAETSVNLLSWNGRRMHHFGHL